MTYTVVSPQPAGLQATIPAPTGPYTVPGTLVELDTGEYVVLGLHGRQMQNLGCLRIDGSAIVTDATGVPVKDHNDHTTSTGYGCTLAPVDATNPATVKAWRQNVLLALLGEPLTIATIQDDPNVPGASIRNAIAAAAHAGPVTDLGAIL